MLKYAAAAFMAISIATSAQAQSVRSTVTASNGVEITVYSDEFANRYEYSAPAITLTDGFALVAKVDRGDTKGPVHLGGSFIYNGDWRFYNSALFKGGDPADFTAEGRDVGRCSSGRSRYSRSSCTLTERFRIDFTNEEAASHTENGVIAIQVRASQTTATAIIQVPTTYLDAINEVAARPRP